MLGMKVSVIVLCVMQIRDASQIFNRHVIYIPICNDMYYPQPTCNLSVLTSHAMRTVSVPGHSMLPSPHA